MKKYTSCEMEIVYLSKDDVIRTSNIILPDEEIGDDIPTFEG